MNWCNVPGESIKCYVCSSQHNPKCADPVDRNGLEPTECNKSVLQEAASAVRKGVDTLGNLFGFEGIPEGPDLKFACQKTDLSGKKL